MQIYFYGPPTKNADLDSTYGFIRRSLKQASVILSSNTQNPESGLDPAEIQGIEARGGSVLDLMDGIVIEGSTPDPEVGYLLAYAIAQKKPTLFLSERGSSGRQILRYLDERKIPKVCQIRNYTQKTLGWNLTEFMKTIDSREVKEIPRIKFTLRITPTIDEYLDWKSQAANTKKADFLRDEIDQLIAKDADFQKYLERKRRRLTSQS